jgi:hypothetical protein
MFRILSYYLLPARRGRIYNRFSHA